MFNMTHMDVTMTPKKNMNHERLNFGITNDEKNKEVYVFGGYDGTVIDHCEKYSVEKDEWIELEPMKKKK